MIIPSKISRPTPFIMKIEWSDGISTSILLEKLRDECPCAMCKGEQIMGQTISLGMKMFAPGMNDLEKLVPVGNYGVQATWKDGHETGIYPWKLLRQIAVQNALSDEQLSNFMA